MGRLPPVLRRLAGVIVPHMTLPQILRRLSALVRRGQLDAEMSDEIRAHLELQATANERRGMSPREARFAAQRAFGGVEQIKERARDERRRGFGWLEHLVQDFRYASRTLRKNPGFTAVVAATLAIGIALNTVVFATYRAVAQKPLAVRAPEEILRLSSSSRLNGGFTFDEFEELGARLHSVSALIATSPPQVVLASDPRTPGQPPDAAAMVLVSENYFSALGVPPILGRTFGPGEIAVTVVGYDAWQRRFKADASVIGRTILLQGVPVMIVGVAPASFGGTGTPPAAPDFWLPMTAQPLMLSNVNGLRDAPARVWELLGRRGPLFNPLQVEAELRVVTRAWPQPDGQPLQPRARPATFFELHGPEIDAIAFTLMLAVALILLVACINVLNLVSARNATRERELAVRLALGASRGRLLAQLCTESVLLGFLGGAGGLLLAWWSCAFIRVAAMSAMREITGTWNLFLDLTPDAHVFAYTVVISLVAGLVVGLAPARRAARVDVEAALKQPSSGQPVRGAWHRRNLLLSTQVAACLLLLAGAGLLFRGAAHAVATDPGFDAKHLFVVMPNLQTIAPTPAERAGRIRDIVARLRALPGVAMVTNAGRPPFWGHSLNTFKTDDGRWVQGCVMISGGAEYFDTLGLHLVAGRLFTADEAESSAYVVVISESAARHLWPGEEPLGRQLIMPKRMRDGTPTPPYTVIGTVRDARLTLLSKTDDIDLFFPRPAAASDTWLVRSRGAPAAEFQSVFAALRTVNANLPSQTTVMTLEAGPMRLQQLWAEAPAKFATLLGAIALLLAAVGTYGVVSFVVARRTREIGIRFALGAQKREVIGLVLRQTLRPAVWGAVVGLGGAMALSILLTRLVLNPEFPDLTYGAGALPSATFAGVAAVLGVVLLTAAYLPARRAAKVDPVVALRTE